jgi:hypothetical protein
MRKTFILGGVAALSLAAAVGAASAQQGPGRHGRDADNDGRISQAEFVEGRLQRLTALDADRDGTVTVEEARAGHQAHRAERQAAMFDRLDANRDGAISRAEFTAPRERPEGARPERAGRHFGGHRRGGPMAGQGPRSERGPVVIAEVRAKMAERFGKLDTDRDGFLSQAERQAGRAAMREQRQERRAARQASPSAAASE